MARKKGQTVTPRKDLVDIYYRPVKDRRKQVTRTQSYYERWKMMPAEERRKRVEADKARFCNLEYLSQRTARGESGCLEWTGLYETQVNGGVYPFVRLGTFGKLSARKAMWLAATGTQVKKNHYIIVTCNNYRCVDPDHMVETNNRIEKIKREAKRNGTKVG